MNETITIGMPVFNDRMFIEESILSILNQTYPHFKLIISDDGSTDGSEEICLKYASIDKRITFIKQSQNLGISKNMAFLLSQANTTFFMWAGDDDLVAPDYCEKLIELLEKRPTVCAAFCQYDWIDEDGVKYKRSRNFDYSGTTPFNRLKKLIIKPDDGFGYGVFRTNLIKGVNFPIWWWPNKKSAYNNIYPTLCYYLAKADYAHLSGNSSFFKRVKTVKNTHHVISGKGNAIKETIAFIIRRFNLVVFSIGQIRRASSMLLAILIFPLMFYHWFVISSWNQIKLAARAFWKNKILKSLS
jgi:glycosyltransferase involved in cell wall biosynthesis